MLVVILAISLLGFVTAIVLPGWSDLLLLAGPCLVASLWLWWRVWRAGPVDEVPAVLRGESPFRKSKARQPKALGPHIILDGSNVMHWQDGAPSLVPVVAAVLALEARGFTVGVIFDANAGYKIQDRYQDDRDMARQLSLPEDRVLVVPKGVPADQDILTAARDLGARVVTNDRYRDWQADFPEVALPGFLIRGGMSVGQLWLNDRDLASTPSVIGRS